MNNQVFFLTNGALYHPSVLPAHTTEKLLTGKWKSSALFGSLQKTAVTGKHFMLTNRTSDAFRNGDTACVNDFVIMIFTPPKPQTIFSTGINKKNRPNNS